MQVTGSAMCLLAAMIVHMSVDAAESLTISCRFVDFKAVVTAITIRSAFDSHSTAVRPRYDHSTTYVTTGLPHCDLYK